MNVKSLENPSKSIKYYKSPRKYRIFCPWIFMDIHQKKRLHFNDVDFHENPWKLMILYGLPWTGCLVWCMVPIHSWIINIPKSVRNEIIQYVTSEIFVHARHNIICIVARYCLVACQNTYHSCIEQKSLFPRLLWPLSTRKITAFWGSRPTDKHSPFHQLWGTVKKRIFSMFRVIAFPETNFFSMLGSYHSSTKVVTFTMQTERAHSKYKTPIETGL